MAASDWRKLCRHGDFSVDGDRVRVALAEQRSHQVHISETEEAYLLRAIVAQASAIQGVEDASLRAWLTNRGTELVGFRVDERGRMVAEAWLPKAGVTAEEFQLYVRRMAIESDRFEFMLTGQDRE